MNTQALQNYANEKNITVYIYQLQNGNRFASTATFTRTEKVQGSKIEKVIDIIKPQK